MLTCALSLLASAGRAHADSGRSPEQGSPRPVASDEAPAPAFVYAVPCESKQTFVEELARLHGGGSVEPALDHNGVAVSIAQTEPGRWVLTLERRTTWGSDVRVVREASCQELANAARVVLSVWLREAHPPPTAAAAPATPSPAPPTAAAKPPPVARPPTALRDDRNSRRTFGVSMLLESSSHLFVAPAAGVTGEVWTRLQERRISFAASYWTSLDEWTGNTDPTMRLLAWDVTLQVSVFGIRTRTLDLGVTGALALGYVRAEELENGVPRTLDEVYIRPTAAGVLIWAFAPSLRLRALLGLTHLTRTIDANDPDWPSPYAAVGVDLEL